MPTADSRTAVVAIDAGVIDISCELVGDCSIANVGGPIASAFAKLDLGGDRGGRGALSSKLLKQEDMVRK